MNKSRWQRFVRGVRDTPADAWLGAIRAWVLIALLVWVALALLGIIR